MQAYNIALFPQDKRLIERCIQLAQENLSTIASEYLLGENAWPHITLCQFEAENNQLPTIWSAVETIEPKSLPIRFHHIYIWPGSKEHINKYWIGLATANDPMLINLQLAICEKLISLGIHPQTVHSAYFPHLTWARCASQIAPDVSLESSDELWQREYLFTISLGLSNKNGVYQKKLFPESTIQQ